MAAVTAGVAAVGASAYSSYKSGKEQAKASKRAAQAAEYKPFNVYGLSTGESLVGTNPETGRWEARIGNGNGMLKMFERQAMNRALTATNLNTDNAFELQFMRQQAIRDQRGLARDAMRMNPENTVGGYANLLQQGGRSGGFLNAIGQGLANEFGQAMRGPNPGQIQSNILFGQGQNFLNRNYNDIANDRLSLLREQAAPEMARQAGAFTNNLQKYGLLNNSSSSGVLAEGFARGQAEADINRQIAAGDFADRQRATDLGVGQNLIGQGMSGLFAGDSANLNRLASLSGQADRLFGSAFNQSGQMFDAGQAVDNSLMSNASRRIALNERLLGFSRDVANQDINTLAGAQGLFSNIEADRRATLQASNAFATGQAQAGANAAQFLQNTGNTAGWNAIGDFAGAFGGAASQAGVFTGLFGG